MGYIYLKIKEIPGEATDQAHKDEIELGSFSHGVSMAIGPRTTAGSGPIGTSSHGDISVSKVVDISTPKIMEAVCKGTTFPEAVITVSKAGGKGKDVIYLTYTMNNVIISNAQLSAADGAGLAQESLSLNYSKIKWEYNSTDPKDGSVKGTVPFTFDLEINKHT